MRASRQRFARVALVLVLAVSFFVRASTAGQSLAQQNQSPSADEKSKTAAIADRLAKFQMAWGPGLNSPGASMQLREISREKVKGETVVTYRILTLGLPITSSYSLMTAGFDYVAVSRLDGLTLDESGQAICAGKQNLCGEPDEPSAPYDLKVVAAKGEPKRFGLVSRDHNFKAFISIVPFPVEGVDAICSVEAILLTPKAEALLVLGRGFPANSEVRMQANSAGETHFTTEMTDDRGNFSKIQLPYVEGKSNGLIRVTAQSKACAPFVDFQWGRDSYRNQ
jgi:hypothetical protein